MDQWTKCADQMNGPMDHMRGPMSGPMDRTSGPTSGLMNGPMDQNEWTNPWPEEEHKVFAHVTAALVDGRIEFRAGPSSHTHTQHTTTTTTFT